MLTVNDYISIDEAELEFQFVRSSGPGGQNVNKVSSAVQLRFDVTASRSLPEAVKARLMRLAGRRLSAEGVLTIDARRFRSQPANRQDAVERLVALVRQAATPPRPRRRTTPTAASRRRRLEGKKHRSQAKQFRRSVGRET